MSFVTIISRVHSEIKYYTVDLGFDKEVVKSVEKETDEGDVVNNKKYRDKRGREFGWITLEDLGYRFKKRRKLNPKP